MDSAVKATALILPILLGKFKTCAVRKREIYSKERFKGKKKPLNVLLCVKNICWVGREKKKDKVLKKKKKKERE